MIAMGGMTKSCFFILFIIGWAPLSALPFGKCPNIPVALGFMYGCQACMCLVQGSDLGLA